MEVALNIVLFVLGLVLGIVLGFGYNEFRKRPLLVIQGSGGGSAPPKDIAYHHAGVSNQPGFIGLRIQPSVVLGVRIHQGKARGLYVDRNLAKGCRALLLDKATGDQITTLYWRVREPRGFSHSVDIPSGESAELMMFAWRPSQLPRYFAYRPDEKSPIGVHVPAEHLQFTGDRTFTVRITYSTGRETSADFATRIDYNGSFHVRQIPKGEKPKAA